MRSRLPGTRFGLIALAGVLLSGALAAPSGGQEPRWQLDLAATTAQSTPGFGLDGDLGWAGNVGYRLSPRLGVGLVALHNRFEDSFDIDFFDFFHLGVKEIYRTTWLLAGLDVHLSPESRADWVIGPVAGVLRTSHVITETEVVFPETSPPFVRESFDAHGGFAWGGRARVDIRLGQGHSYLTTGVTYVRSRVSVEQRPFGGPSSFDIDPLIVHLGYGWRF